MRPLCPFPDKTPYPTKREALIARTAQQKRNRRGGSQKRLSVYPCPCHSWHVGHPHDLAEITA